MKDIFWMTCLCAVLVFALPGLPAMAAGQSPAPTEAAEAGESIAGGPYKPLGIYVAPKIGMSIMRIKGRSMTLDALPAGIPISSISVGLNGESGGVFGGGISLGYDFAPRMNIPVRLELDYTTRSEVEVSASVRVVQNPIGLIDFEGTQKDKITLQTLMLNAWFDIPTDTSFSPYVGGGIGWAFIGHKGSQNGEFVQRTIAPPPPDPIYSGSGSSSETNFAWSLGCGLAYDFTPNWSLDLGYRYINAEHSSTTMSGFDNYHGRQRSFKSKVEIECHDIMLALRFTF